MKISIVIPCYNEIKTIEKINKKVQDVFINHDFEIVIIDDYSNDGSRDLCVDVFSCEEVSVTHSSATFYNNTVLVHRMNM